MSKGVWTCSSIKVEVKVLDVSEIREGLEDVVFLVGG